MYGRRRGILSFLDLIVISVGLAMDAFSVAVCKGLSMKKTDYKGGFVTALFFGVFQAVMPVIGYFLGSYFASFITRFSPWVALILLTFIGGKMFIEAVREKSGAEAANDYKLDIKELFVMSLATSIDALAVGIVFVDGKTNIFYSSAVIGIITFVISLAGVLIGNKFGSRYEKKAQMAGGIVLVLIGVKIFLEGIGVL